MHYTNCMCSTPTPVNTRQTASMVLNFLFLTSISCYFSSIFLNEMVTVYSYTQQEIKILCIGICYWFGACFMKGKKCCENLVYQKSQSWKFIYSLLKLLQYHFKHNIMCFWLLDNKLKVVSILCKAISYVLKLTRFRWVSAGAELGVIHSSLNLWSIEMLVPIFAEQRHCTASLCTL